MIDLSAIFTGTLDEIEAAEAVIAKMQPYSLTSLHKAGNAIVCPNCGNKAIYTEYQSGENRWTGSAEMSWMYECRCGWHSLESEL